VNNFDQENIMNQIVNNNILNKLNLNKRIFRITKLDYVLESLQTNESTFSNPRSWEDPYDSIFIRSNIRLKDGSIANQNYKNNYFLQCWCYQRYESDAMWHIHARPSNENIYDKVMIFSNLDNLWKSLWNELDNLRDFEIFLDKIEYIYKKKLLKENFFKNTFTNSKINEKGLSFQLASTFLYKTNAYEHENEIRFIINKEINQNNDRIKLRHNIAYSDIIDKILVHPKASKDFCDDIITRIAGLGFTKINVHQSTMLKQKDIIYNF
jgi:hypothetical protein